MDVNAPDLFIPVMAAWTYALLNCVVLTLNGKFQAEMMSKMVSSWRYAEEFTFLLVC